MVWAISTPPISISSTSKLKHKTFENPYQIHSKSLLSSSSYPKCPLLNHRRRYLSPLSPKASVGSAEYVVEPSTDVKFQKDLSIPGCSNELVLFGTGYREKVFAIIGVKVYSAGFYANRSLTESLSAWKGKSATHIQEDSSLCNAIFKAPCEKSLKIVLVRDVDGKTFWDALDDAISPRIKEPTAVDESSLSIFRQTFQGRPLNKGTSIFLTWIDPSKLVVSISSDGAPSTVDATIESLNVSFSLFAVFFGDGPVSPTLKGSAANGLAIALN
ncbi:Fatty-acid-binding protein 3 [Acorus gramineus]|uniref:Chalcone-flavonone isomerase family protein n=1 Tax=Acorus gramineus TaxID=55184 RepID=A0AAV9BHA7_ACOGR|nr:Fatty-acid-binding protein 3 [Acorus gramineus]